MIDDALQHVLCGAAKQDGWMRLLGGLGIGTHRWEIEEFPMKLRGILGPERFHYLERLPRLRPAPRKIAAKYFHFLPQPPCADAKNEAAAAMVIEGSDLFGQMQWVALRYERDAGGQPQRGCYRRGARKGNIRLGKVRVSPGDSAARGRERTGALNRYGRVFGIPDRFKAQAFRGSAHEGGVDGVCRQGHGQSDSHDGAPSLAALWRSVVPSQPRGNPMVFLRAVACNFTAPDGRVARASTRWVKSAGSEWGRARRPHPLK